MEAALRRRDPSTVVLLFYGPDAGLVAERARAAAERAVETPGDPFQLVRLDGDLVATDPARLADEAATIGLFGHRRAIWVRPTSRNIAPAVEAALAQPLKDVLLVIEAGDLAKSSPLRLLCERARNALALPCYPDEGRTLGAVVDEALETAGLRIGREARDLLLASLGGDRLATRSEIEKLVLYTVGRREVTVEDVEAIVSDVSSLAFDAVIDAAFLGQRATLDEAYRRLEAEGTTATAVLGAALRHGLALLAATAQIETGRPAASVLATWRGLHFKRRDAIAAQLARWRQADLVSAITDLQQASLNARRFELGHAAALHALFQLASRPERRNQA